MALNNFATENIELQIQLCSKRNCKFRLAGQASSAKLNSTKPGRRSKTFQVEKENLEGYSETPEAQAKRLAAEHPQRRAQIFSIRGSDLLKLTSWNDG